MWPLDHTFASISAIQRVWEEGMNRFTLGRIISYLAGRRKQKFVLHPVQHKKDRKVEVIIIPNLQPLIRIGLIFDRYRSHQPGAGLHGPPYYFRFQQLQQE